jgi:DedD protein
VKERLTGAIILVALIVLLVPELLTGPVRSATAPQPAATSAEESPLRSYTIDLADETRSRGDTGGSTGPAAPQPAAATPGTPEPSTAAKPATISEGAPAAASADPAASASNSSAPPPQQEKPQVAPEQPVPQERPAPAPRPRAAAKAPAPAHHLAVAAKPPEPKPPEAKQPEVKPSPSQAKPSTPQSEHSAPPSEASSGGAGWVVQLGVFASRTNADRLAEELKGKGFKVAVSEVAGNGRKLYRVRSAPLGDRTAAQDLAVKLRAAGATGSVVPRT